MEAADHVAMGSVFAVALAVVKMLEHLVLALVERFSAKEDKKVELAEEPSRMIRETYENSERVHDIVGRHDDDGVPMVYTPRSSFATQQRMADALTDISNSHDRLSEKVDEVLSEIKKKG